MRILCLIIAVAGAYTLLRGWDGGPGLLLRSCLAVATLVAGLALWSSGRYHRLPRMFCQRRTTWLDYLSLGGAIVFTEACFVVITSTLAEPAQDLTDAFHEIINPIRQGDENQDGSPEFDGHTSGNWLFTNSLERNLPANSNHKPSNKPEVFVELDSKADAQRLLTSRAHLQSFTLSKFNGVTWSARRTTATRHDAPILFPRTDHSLVRSKILKHTVYHAVNPTGQNVLVSLQGTISTGIGPLTKISDAIHMLPPPSDPAAGYEYSCVSRPVDFTSLIGSNPEVAAAGDTYLALPESELIARIRTTATEFANEENLTDKLISLRIHLQDNYTYSLETTNASGANPVENFLFEEKRGYCEHFATATVLLCRALGVPSRIAYGWSGGRLYPAQNMFVFRAKDAHAWAEIKLKGYGWVVFDTTPPDASDVPTAHSATESETAPNPSEATATELPVEENENLHTALTLPGEFDSTRLIAALVVIGICCAGFLIARRGTGGQTDAQGRAVSTPAPGYLQLFKQACASHGSPMPQGRTLRQHIRELVTSGNSPAFVDDLLSYHYATLYGDLPRDPTREKSLTSSIRQWSRQQPKG